MRFALSVFATSLLATFAQAQSSQTQNPEPQSPETQSPETQSPDGSAPRKEAQDPRVLLDYAQFDPLVGVPAVPEQLRAGGDVNLHIVQFRYTPTDADRAAVRELGGEIDGYLPHDCHLVTMPNGAMALYQLEQVRWVGPYEPAYRVEPFLLQEIASGKTIPTRRYNLVMVDKRNDKGALEAAVLAMGGKVFRRHDGGLLFTVDLDHAQLLQAARLDEVLWIDRFTDVEYDMNNARTQGGANYLESVGGYTGVGIRGHVYEGVEANHPDFSTVMTQVGPALCTGADSHGHCTAGIVFGNGTSTASARGMAPDAVGFYTRYVGSTNTTCATSPARNTIIGQVVNTHQCMFTTASWGNARTFFYTSDSADADDIVFDHRIPWTQSQSNAGNQDSRPQAWAKNVISVGGVYHYNDSNPANDSWNGGGSTGPAQDGRNKPDLAAYYDSVLTSDRTGASGYSSGNWTSGFNGTSAATPIVAGHNALAIQMYTDHIFDVPPRVPGGTRFQNRPFAQTLKALQVACANMYTPTATDNRREHVGYGFPSLRNMYDRRDKISIIPEDVRISQGQTRSYSYEVFPNESILKVVMTYLDPAGNPAAAFDRVNDLDLTVTAPNGAVYRGNWGLDGASQTNQSASGGFRDSRDTLEVVVRNNPMAGIWRVDVTAPTISQDAYLPTAATDATFALVFNGGRRLINSGCARYLPDPSRTSDDQNMFPFGGYTPSENDTTFASNNFGSLGNCVYFDVTVTEPVWIHSFDVNTSSTAGVALHLDLYTRSGTALGNETNAAGWTARTAGRGESAGPDTPSRISLAQPFRLPAGTHGFALKASNFIHRYTNGSNSYTVGAMTLDLGSATNGLFGGPGGVYSPRTANISVNFRNADATAQNMRYQTIIRSDELGGPGRITGLAFAGEGDGRHYSSNLQVRMAHRPAGYELVPNMTANISGSSLVMNANTHTFEYSDSAWRNIGLPTGFNYNGTSDLVIEIVSRGNVQTSTGFGEGAFYADNNRERVVAQGWDLSMPATGTRFETNSLRMRVEFGCANANEIGSSCGTLEAYHSGSSVLGGTFTYRVRNAPPNFFAWVGLGENSTFPYPLSLDSVGWTNCKAFSQSLVTLSAPTNASGTAAYSLGIPNVPAIAGYRLYGQWLTFDTSEPGNLTFSDATFLTVGTNP